MIDPAKIFQFKDLMSKLRMPDNKLIKPNVKKNMTRWLSFLLFASLPCFGFSQFGLNVKAFKGQSKTLDTVNISQDGIHASVEYNFRLKQKRIEFRPGLGYRFTLNGANQDGYFTSIDLDLNTAIYPFDFAGDCHCPTFSKSGDLFKKGFFLEINPGAGYQILSRLRSDPDDPARLPIRSKNIEWKLGGSVGLDIGLSDRLTLTPLLSATYLTASEWDGLRSDGSVGEVKDYAYFGAGLRITFNQDDKRRRRY